MENGDPGELHQLPGKATGSLYLTSALGSSAVENGEGASPRLPRLRGTPVVVFYTGARTQWTMENGDRQTKKCRVPSKRGSGA